MTDYKNELEQIKAKYCSGLTPAAQHDLGKELEALLSKHSKKRELEARIDEAQAAEEVYLMTVSEGFQDEEWLKVIRDRINQLGGQE